MIEFKDPVAEQIKAFILDETAFDIDSTKAPSHPVWKELRDKGSRIWLQGDENLAAEVWSAEMDTFFLGIGSLAESLNQDSPEYPAIEEANKYLKGLPKEERIKEILFIINARQALRISKMLAATVSVEIPVFPPSPHETRRYAQRLYQVCPEHIAITLPFSPQMVPAITDLVKHGIPVTVSGIKTAAGAMAAVAATAPASLILSPGREVSASQLASRTARVFSTGPPSHKSTELIITGICQHMEISALAGFPVISLDARTARHYLQSRQFEGKTEGGNLQQLPSAKRPTRNISGKSAEMFRKIAAIINRPVYPD